MTQFSMYRSKLRKSPLTEAVRALHEKSYRAFIESVCAELGCRELARPLQEGFSVLYESLTEPTMHLRKSYRNAREKDCPGTPEFNKVWHEVARYDGSAIAFDALYNNRYLIQKVFDRWEADGEHDDIRSRFAGEDSLWGMTEQDIKSVMEADPSGVADIVYDSADYEQNDLITMDFNHTVMNGWLVHNSDRAWDIWREGFKYGNDIGHLAYTGDVWTAGQDYGPYLFAFPIGKAPSPNSRGLRYGKDSIVFVGTGNEFYHYGDNENQVIFDRHLPKGCFIVTKQEYPNEDGYADYWCVIGENEHHPLYHSDEYQDCLKWIQRNGNRYMGQMRMWSKETPGRQVADERMWP